MHRHGLFWVLLGLIISHSYSFSNVRSSSSSVQGLSFEAIEELARKRYHSNLDVRYGNHSPPLKGKVAVITGAAGGIGGQLSKIVYRLGGTVVALDRDAVGLDALQRSLIEEYSDYDGATNVNNGAQISSNYSHDRIIIIPTNHEDLSSVASAAETIKSRFAQVDILVNNAGVTYSNKSMVSAHGKDLAFTVNYLSHFLLTEKLLEALSNGGRIVHVTSTYHWKVDGSELLPDKENGTPIAYESDPQLQSAKHLQRSYANTKLAQIWHSRSIAKALPNGGRCSSVCVCPSWAATGIAGEDRKDFLERYAFATSDCGPGITSAINGMLRTDEELGDALNEGKSFVANSRILEYVKVKRVMTSDFVSKILGWRDFICDLIGVAILLGQKYTHQDFIIQQTSPESFNDIEKRERFYQWSKEEVKRCLQ